MKRESFIFYESYKTALEYLPEEDKLPYLFAIIDYALNGIEPNIEGSPRACFELVRPIIDKNNHLYENGKKGAEYGKKGGRPRENKPQDNPKETPNKPQDNPKETPEEEEAVAEEVEDEDDKAVAEAAEYTREEPPPTSDKAKQEFFKAFPSVRLNGADDSGVDYGKLLEAFQEGNDYLQNTKSMNYVTAHYVEIIGGGYRRARESPPAIGQRQEKNAMQVWQSIENALGLAKKKRYCQRVGAEVPLYCLAKFEGKKDFEKIYNATLTEVKNFYSVDGFLSLCELSDNDLKYERARFLKAFG